MSASEVGGFKEIVANVTGTGVFAKLKFESGVHRVQRVPETESGPTPVPFIRMYNTSSKALGLSIGT